MVDATGTELTRVISVEEVPAETAAAEAQFRESFPEYAGTASIDRLRAEDYGRLDATGQLYLDYTGGGLYGESQIREHCALLREAIYGNPHSLNPTSQAASRLVESARDAVHAYFDASPDEYAVIFTANASAAIKLVAESFPFEIGGEYLLSYDNHNSINGIREYAWRSGADVTYVPVAYPDLRPVESELFARLDRESTKPRLFAYPAQSNFSGAKHPLEWVGQARDLGWQVLLDAAAFVPCNPLRLSEVAPDFTVVSFYKMFGFPTGVGALIARRESLARLRRPWFAGGTISLASVQGEHWHYLLPGESGFEDGTVNYLGLPALVAGFAQINKVGIETVRTRVTCLTEWLLCEMLALRHSSGVQLVKVFGPQTSHNRGGTISFNFVDCNGTPQDARRIEELAADEQISLRTGCFCNPGAGEVAHQITEAEMAQVFRSDTPVSFEQFVEVIEGMSDKSASTVRLSLGLVSNFADAHRFLRFARGFLDKNREEVGRKAAACSVLARGNAHLRDAA